MTRFYRMFINNFSGICAPIIKSIKKDRKPFHWTTTKTKNSFQFLNKRITKKLVLKFLDFNHLFQVKCDASGIDIGAMLSDEDKPIEYFSEN